MREPERDVPIVVGDTSDLCVNRGDGNAVGEAKAEHVERDRVANLDARVNPEHERAE